MSQAFKADARSVGDLLSGVDKPKLMVPAFQRGYSWEKKHVESFWRDLIEFQKDKQDGMADKYFLGPIVVLYKDDERTIELLDGQQRLATATILFTVMRDCAMKIGTTESEALAHAIHTTFIAKDDAGDHLGYSLELGAMDKLYFEERVQARNHSQRTPTIRSHRNIQKAQSILRSAVEAKLSGLSPAESIDAIKRLRNIVRSDVIMTCIPVAAERDAFRIFETLNDRGLRLSVPDLLLNYLMRMAPDGDRPDIREYWNQMLDSMGRRNISQFLRHVWVSQFGDLKRQDLFTALKAHIEAEGHDISKPFAARCAEQCKQYCSLLDADQERLGVAAQHVRHLIGALDCQAVLPLLLSAYDTLALANFAKVTEWLLVFVARYSVFCRLDSSGQETIFFELAKEVRIMLSDTNDPKSEGRCLTHIKAVLRKSAPSDDRVIAAMDDLTLSPDEATYVISKVATRMQTNTKELKTSEANVEHVFPKKPGPEWNNTETLEPFLWHIGNLTYLGERINNSVENRGYDFKKARYAQASELEITKEIPILYPVWDEQAIKERAVHLCPVILDIWNFDNPSRV